MTPASKANLEYWEGELLLIQEHLSARGSSYSEEDALRLAKAMSKAFPNGIDDLNSLIDTAKVIGWL